MIAHEHESQHLRSLLCIHVCPTHGIYNPDYVYMCARLAVSTILALTVHTLDHNPLGGQGVFVYAMPYCAVP